MEKRKKKRYFTLVIAVVILLSCTTAVLATGGNWFTGGTNRSGEAVRYEKPALGALTGDGAYPETESSSASASVREKQWYEYIMYTAHSRYMNRSR